MYSKRIIKSRSLKSAVLGISNLTCDLGRKWYCTSGDSGKKVCKTCKLLLMIRWKKASSASLNNTSIACKLLSQKPKRLVKKELMRERSAAEHDPAQAGEQYVSLAMTVARKIYKDWVGVPWLRKVAQVSRCVLWWWWWCRRLSHYFNAFRRHCVVTAVSYWLKQRILLRIMCFQSMHSVGESRWKCYGPLIASDIWTDGFTNSAKHHYVILLADACSCGLKSDRRWIRMKRHLGNIEAMGHADGKGVCVHVHVKARSGYWTWNIIAHKYMSSTRLWFWTSLKLIFI